MEQTECSETSEYKIQTPGKFPEENMQHMQKSDAGDAPERLLTISKTQRKFEIKSTCKVCALMPSKFGRLFNTFAASNLNF
jgi:hypothetical protein